MKRSPGSCTMPLADRFGCNGCTSTFSFYYEKRKQLNSAKMFDVAEVVIWDHHFFILVCTL
jgi:hypothetical protein